MEVSSSVSTRQDALGHRAATGCMMTAIPCCCSCADKRPQAAAYPVYIDGKGIRMQGKRWQRYCRKCHDHWQSLASDIETSAPSQPVPVSGPSVSAEPEMSPPHIPYHTRSGRSAEWNEDRHFNPSFAVHSGITTSTAVSDHQHQGATTNTPQNGNSSGIREQVYPLGSREDVQQDDYESPLAGLFGRAYGRYREAEAARQAAQANGYEANSSWNNQGQFTTVYRPAINPLLDPAGIYQQTQAAQAQIQDNINMRLGHLHNDHDRPSRDIDVGTVRSARNFETLSSHVDLASGLTQASLNPRATRFVPDNLPASSIMRSHLRRQRLGFHRQFYTDSITTFGQTVPLPNPFDDNQSAVNPIDAQLSRPTPVKSEDLKVDLACKICTEQKINTVCMPCMHACMCRWCAAIHKNDCRDYDTGRWSGALWKCPICRKTIQEVKRLYI